MSVYSQIENVEKEHTPKVQFFFWFYDGEKYFCTHLPGFFTLHDTDLKKNYFITPISEKK